MTACAIEPQDKRRLGRRVGRDLQRRYGRKSHYAPAEIRSSMRRLEYPYTWDCWALSLYASPFDFDAFHRARNEVCDYQGMHAAMASCLGESGSFWSGLADFFSFDWSWPSWLDFDFDFFDRH